MQKETKKCAAWLTLRSGWTMEHFESNTYWLWAARSQVPKQVSPAHGVSENESPSSDKIEIFSTIFLEAPGS